MNHIQSRADGGRIDGGKMLLRVRPRGFCAGVVRAVDIVELALEAPNGDELGRMLRNPTYTGIGPQFWASMDLVGNETERRFWGTPHCGKGQPVQTGHTGHPAVPSRFRNVRVGVRG